MKAEAYKELAAAVNRNPEGDHRAVVIDGPDEERMRLEIDGIDVGTLFVEVFSEQTGAWIRANTGRWRMNIGPYGSKKQFIQRKDGTFDYDRGASVLIRLVDQIKAENLRKDLWRHNEAIALRVLDGAGRTPPNSKDGVMIAVRPSIDERDRVYVTLTVTRLVNEDGARERIAQWQRLIEGDEI